MRINLVEACEPSDAGSIGAFYIANQCRLLGHEVISTTHPQAGCDLELVSLHHCTDFVRLATMARLSPLRIVGGHPLQNNPRPAIPFADVLCIGEGESWLKQALHRLEKRFNLYELADLPGTIVSPDWHAGDAIPTANIESDLPDNPPYLNWAGSRSASWYIEIARGCPFRCHYCELGHSTRYRERTFDQIVAAIDQCDMQQTRKINFFAPDEASHTDYTRLHDYVKNRGFMAGFSSMRVDTFLKHRPSVRNNHLIRVGIDGLSQNLRFKVGKKISDDMIIEYFRVMIDSGHCNFKMFMMFGYPWESLEDFDQFERLMRRVFRLDLRKNVSLRVKWTPLIPQPVTPLGEATPRYDTAMVKLINAWHELHARPRRTPGWYVENDGLMSQATHRRQCMLAAGDESTLMGMPGAMPLWRKS